MTEGGAFRRFGERVLQQWPRLGTHASDSIVQIIMSEQRCASAHYDKVAVSVDGRPGTVRRYNDERFASKRRHPPEIPPSLLLPPSASVRATSRRARVGNRWELASWSVHVPAPSRSAEASTASLALDPLLPDGSSGRT